MSLAVRRDLCRQLFHQLLGGDQDGVPNRCEGRRVGQVQLFEFVHPHVRLQGGSDDVDSARGAVLVCKEACFDEVLAGPVAPAVGSPAAEDGSRVCEQRLALPLVRVGQQPGGNACL